VNQKRFILDQISKDLDYRLFRNFSLTFYFGIPILVKFLKSVPILVDIPILLLAFLVTK